MTTYWNQETELVPSFSGEECVSYVENISVSAVERMPRRGQDPIYNYLKGIHKFHISHLYIIMKSTT